MTTYDEVIELAHVKHGQPCPRERAVLAYDDPGLVGMEFVDGRFVRTDPYIKKRLNVIERKLDEILATQRQRAE